MCLQKNDPQILQKLTALRGRFAACALCGPVVANSRTSRAAVIADKIFVGSLGTLDAGAAAVAVAGVSLPADAVAEGVQDAVAAGCQRLCVLRTARARQCVTGLVLVRISTAQLAAVGSC